MADYLASVTIQAEYWVTAETQSAAIELVQGYASVAGEGTTLIVSDLTDVEVTDIRGCADCQRLHAKCESCDSYDEGDY